MPLRKRPHHLVMPSRDSRCCYDPCGPHTGGPNLSTPDRSWPSWSRGWWSPLPGAGPARRKLLQEPKFCSLRPQLGIPPRPPSGAAELKLNLRLPRLGSHLLSGTMRSGPFPQPGSPSRAPQAAGTAPRNAGLRGWPWRPGRATGRDRQAPPEQDSGDHRRA